MTSFDRYYAMHSGSFSNKNRMTSLSEWSIAKILTPL